MKHIKNVRVWLVALALAIPSIVVAQDTPSEVPVPPPEWDRPTEPDTREPLTAPTPIPQPEARMGDEKMSMVKGAVLPMIAGVGAGELAAAALHELASSDSFERRDARATTELAEAAINVAHERASHLHKMSGLSTEARSEAGSAKYRLEEARDAIKRIEREVGVIEGLFQTTEAEKVRSEAMRLHTALANAKQAIDKVAMEYQIPTRLDLSERGTVIGRDYR